MPGERTVVETGVNSHAQFSWKTDRITRRAMGCITATSERAIWKFVSMGKHKGRTGLVGRDHCSAGGVWVQPGMRDGTDRTRTDTAQKEMQYDECRRCGNESAYTDSRTNGGPGTT
jgi:hypothetical protein